MRRELPQELGARLVLEGETVGLNLEDARVDVRELRRLGTIDPSQRNETWLQAAQAVLGETTGGFLEGWEEVARVTEGRGASQGRVEQLAESFSSIRVDLIRDVGRSLLDLGDGARAAQCLQEGLDVRPDREDVRALLARAYAQTGQLERAEDLRREA
jgi:tetratricopeptide (TPR) repeat protein